MIYLCVARAEGPMARIATPGTYQFLQNPLDKVYLSVRSEQYWACANAHHFPSSRPCSRSFS